MIAAGYADVIVEIDDFWSIGGTYKYFGGLDKESHHWAKALVKNYLLLGKRVIVPDVFETVAHVNEYVEIAKELNLPYLVLKANSLWSRNPDKLAELNLHGVKKHLIEQILRIWEDYPGEFPFFAETNIKDIFPSVLSNKE